MNDETSGALLRYARVTDPNRAGKPRVALALLVAMATVAALGCEGTQGPILTSAAEGISSGGSAATGGAGSAGTAAAAGNAATGPVTPPSAAATWQIQLEGSVDTSVDAELFIIDLDAPSQVFDELETGGRTVMCFFSAGSFEPWRDDADALPPSVLGESLEGYPDEQWLDIRDPAVAAVMVDRVGSAAARGCDGVLPANLDGFLLDSGFPLVREDQVGFNRRLANAAHEAGLSIGLAGGDAALAEALISDFDWAYAVGCVPSGCSHLASFLAAGRAVFVVHYGSADDTDTVCTRASELGLNAILKTPELDATRIACP